MSVETLSSVRGYFSRFWHSVVSLFPERQVFLRSEGHVSFVTFSRKLQVAAAVLIVIFCGWVTYATVYYFSFDWILREKNKQIAEARIAYRAVMDQVANHNERLMTITRSLEIRQNELMGKFAQVDGGFGLGFGPGGRVDADLSGVMAAASHRVLTSQIREIESEWGELISRSATLELGLASIGSEVDTVLAEHTDVTQQRDELQAKVNRLQVTVSSLRSTQSDLLDRLLARASSGIREMEKVVTMAGLSIDELVRASDELDREVSGTGGPFVEVSARADDPLDEQVTALDAKLVRWQQLQRILEALPLTAPLDSYRITSDFGKRKDPMNGRWSLHQGIDMAFHANTPILAPAPGKVVFVGSRGNYGRVAEIDHGMGIRTVYAHMRKIDVKAGDYVQFRDKVGTVGSSGRSTGPHVHYEIKVNGEPVDPMNFINAGKHVFKG